jgi:hypothetical protein
MAFITDDPGLLDELTPDNKNDSERNEDPIPGGWRIILASDSDQYTRGLKAPREPELRRAPGPELRRSTSPSPGCPSGATPPEQLDSIGILTGLGGYGGYAIGGAIGGAGEGSPAGPIGLGVGATLGFAGGLWLYAQLLNDCQ